MEKVVIGTICLSLLPHVRYLLRHKSTDTMNLKIIGVGILLWHLYLKSRPKEKEEIRVEKYAIANALGGLFITKVLKLMKVESLGKLIAFSTIPTIHDYITTGDGDVPAIIALVLGLVMNQIEAASVILLMVTGGEVLEERALNKAGNELHELLQQSPGFATLEQDNRKVNAESVKVGDVFLVRMNEVIPIDGVIENRSTGEVLIDEKIITGESVAKLKGEGEIVCAGSVNVSGKTVRVKAVREFEQSVLNQMKIQLALSLERKSRLEFESKKLSDLLTPLTFVFCFFGFHYATRIQHKSEWESWKIVLSLFMSATPCPANIGVPVAMLTAMSKANKTLACTIKSGIALEALADCKVVVFDKTGTLTNGIPKVCSFELRGEAVSESEGLKIIASLQRHVKHVFSDAVVSFYLEEAKRAGGDGSFFPAASFEYSPGLGVCGWIEHGARRSKAIIGSRRFLEAQNVWPAIGAQEWGEVDRMSTTSYFYLETADAAVAFGKISYRDDLRKESAELIERLRRRGLKVVLLSGDDSARLSRVAAALNVSEFHSCLPNEKAAFVKQYKTKYGKVVMVGDGVNDSPALAEADAGIAIDSSSLASESASIVILSGDIMRVDDLIGLAKRCVGVARRTVFFGTLASVVQMSFALSGFTSPFHNAVIQEMIDLGSITYSASA